MATTQSHSTDITLKPITGTRAAHTRRAVSAPNYSRYTWITPNVITQRGCERVFLLYLLWHLFRPRVKGYRIIYRYRDPQTGEWRETE